MTKYANPSRFARVLSVAGKIAAVVALVVLASTLFAPNASAGALWYGIGYETGYYGGVGVYAEPSLVYRPSYYYFGPYAYYGYAVDYTYFYRFLPYYYSPWVWGFWDPPSNPQLTDTIQYAEIFAGLDGSGNPLPLNGIDVSSSDVISDVDGHHISGTIINGTADQIIAAIDPSDQSRVSSLLSAYIGDSSSQFSAALYTVQIQDVAQATPEPASLALFGGGGLLIFAGRWRRRRRPR